MESASNVNRTLEVTGTYKGLSGHDNHTRSIVRALHRQGVRLQLNDLPKWGPFQIAERFRDPWFDTLQESVGADSHLYFCMPHQVEPRGGQRIVNYTMFEADRIPPDWVKQAQQHDLIVVPVNSCRQAWIDSGVPAEKVRVCPLGVDGSVFMPPAKRFAIKTVDGSPCNKRYVFLNISDAIERKNLIGLLRVWLSATSSSDDAALIVKTRFWQHKWHERFVEQLKEAQKSSGKTLGQAAPILPISKILNQNELARLYGAATHYISASHGEGFDLPMIEAAFSGCELIAPRHTSYLDYLNDDIAHLVQAQKVEAILPDADEKTQQLFSGASWWQPDEDQLCATIRAIIDGKSPGKGSARQALASFNWDRTAQTLAKLIFEGG